MYIGDNRRREIGCTTMVYEVRGQRQKIKRRGAGRSADAVKRHKSTTTASISVRDNGRGIPGIGIHQEEGVSARPRHHDPAATRAVSSTSKLLQGVGRLATRRCVGCETPSSDWLEAAHLAERQEHIARFEGALYTNRAL